MLWIGIMFILIIWFDWRNQSQRKMKLRKKMIPMMFSLLLLILSLILFKLKDKMNIAMLMHFLTAPIKAWLFGKT